MQNLMMDVRVALRGFARARGYTAAAALTLAVGVGATTSVFALLNALLLRPLAVERQHELVTLELLRDTRGGMPLFSWPQYTLLRENMRGMSDVAAHSFTEYGVALPGDEPRFMPVFEVSGNYFELLGVRPAAGRFFTSEEVDGRGGQPVVVVSYDFWRTHLGGSGDALGRTLHVNGQPLAIIGVAPAGYRGTIPTVGADFWLPLTLVPVLRPGTNIDRAGGMHWLTLVGRLAPGVTAGAAAAQLSAVVRALEGDDGAAGFTAGASARGRAVGIALAPLRAIPAMVMAPATAFLLLLLATAGMVLLIAGVNVTSMALARSTARAREMAVRRSLGATRGRLVHQILTENVLLFLFGGVGGLLIAVWVAAAVPALAARLPFHVALDVPLDWRVLAFALLLASIAGLLFGLVPALHATEGGLTRSLREGSGAPRRTRLRSAFVVAQLALSLTLLVLGGLLGRAMQRGLATDPGFDPGGVVVAELDLRPYGYDAEGAHAFFTRLTERLEARSDITASGASSMQPLLGFGTLNVRPDGIDEAPSAGIYYNVVDHGFIDALRVPLRIGRGFDARDDAGAPAVAIVNEAFVNRFWPGENPIGKRIWQGPAGSESSIEVVGVVATGRYRSLTEQPEPFFMIPLAQSRQSSAYIYARGPGSTTALGLALREEVRALDAAVPFDTNALSATIGMLLLPQRIASGAVGAFGMIGLLLAGIGLYGVVAFTVSQRRREIGIRIALGAQSGAVVRLFLRQGARLLAMGAAVGLLLALAGGHALSALLFGVSPRDPLTFAAVVLLLAAVALVATWLPARRASGVDPMVVLRME